MIASFSLAILYSIWYTWYMTTTRIDGIDCGINGIAIKDKKYKIPNKLM